MRRVEDEAVESESRRLGDDENEPRARAMRAAKSEERRRTDDDGI